MTDDRSVIMDEDLIVQVEHLLAGPRPLPLVHAGDPVLRQGAADYVSEIGST